MIDARQISDKCIIAAATAYDDAARQGATHERAFAFALAAALNAWPNVTPTSATDHLLVARPALVLPLPKEGSEEPRKKIDGAKYWDDPDTYGYS